MSDTTGYTGLAHRERGIGPAMSDTTGYTGFAHRGRERTSAERDHARCPTTDIAERSRLRSDC